MRGKDILLSSPYPDIKTYEELENFLADSMKDSIASLPPASRKYGILALLFFLCGYASLGELRLILGGFFGRYKNIPSKMIDTGSLEKYALPTLDIGAKLSYHVTDMGYNSYLSCISNDLKDGGGVSQKKRTTAKKALSNSRKKEERKPRSERLAPLVPLHDYGVGVSILSLLTLRRRISIQKEVSFYSGAAISTSGKMRSDAWITLQGNGDFHLDTRIYLEQDMGTESTRQLMNKLIAYGEGRFVNPDTECIILSCYAPSGALASHVDSASVRKVVKAFEYSCCPDLYSFYEEVAPTLDRDIYSVTEMILLVTGAAVQDKSGKITPPPSGGLVITPEWLENYLADVVSLNGPYVERFVNLRLYNNAKRTFYSLCEAVCRRARQGVDGEVSGFLNWTILRGLSIFVLPSTLLANSSGFFMLTDGAAGLMRYRNAIEGYYPHGRLDSYAYVSGKFCRTYDVYVKRFEVSDGSNYRLDMKFEHCFVPPLDDPKGTVICLEHIGRDIGAFFRLFVLSHAVKRADLNIHVIAVCDSPEDAIAFAKVAEPLLPETNPDGTEFRVSFLFESSCSVDGTAPLFEFSKPYRGTADCFTPSTLPLRRDVNTNMSYYSALNKQVNTLY